MGTLANGEVVAPFANAAMRLLREDWKGKYGSKMLAEELFPILQTGIPQPDQNFQNFITVNAGEDGKLLSLIDKFGQEIYKVEEFGPNQINKGLQPVEPPGYPPPKLKPRIEWDEKTIAAGESIDAGELDALAVDPETGDEVDGVYVYDPPDGTTFATPGTASLYVRFTPTDMVKYRRAMGRTTLTITGGVDPPFIYFSWAPPDIWCQEPLSGTQLNAIARDSNTDLEVPGSYVYTPAAGAGLDVGEQNLHVQFTPTDLVTYDVTDADTQIIVKGIAFVQLAAGTLTVTSGNLLVVAAATTHVSFGVTVTVTDSKGNGYTQIGSYNEQIEGAGFVRISLWRAVANSSGSNTVTVTPSAGTLQSVTIVEYEGQHPSSMGFDAFDSSTGFGGDPPESGTPAISADRELVVSFVAGDTAGAASTTGFSLRNNQYRDNVDARATTTGLTAPHGGANTPVDGVGGTATTFWCGISASFKHRTS